MSGRCLKYFIPHPINNKKLQAIGENTMGKKSLTVKFAGIEYECGSEQEANDLRLAVSRAENTLRDQALKHAQSQNGLTEDQTEGLYRGMSRDLTNDPQQMSPLITNELHSIDRERKEQQRQNNPELHQERDLNHEEEISLA
jgi:hypothetical protein